MYDLCIVGGGAAGISCAITAGRLGLKVLLVDKNNKLGKKLYATGNGRCNLTNMNLDVAKHFNSNNSKYADFINYVFFDAYNSKTANSQIIDFMDSLGVSTVDHDNYIYPRSAQASSVVWAMLDELNTYNIEILSNTEITAITGEYPCFTLKCENKAYTASQIVLANGGAAYKSLGGSMSGYSLAKALGHKIIPTRPSLCGLCVKEDLTDIAGVRADAYIKLLDQSGNIVQSSVGELQLTKQGISGICIFEISSKAGQLMKEGKSPKVQISFLHSHDNKIYQDILLKINNNELQNRTVIGFLNGYVNDKLAQYICKLHNIDGKQRVPEISNNQLKKLVDCLNNLEFNITSLYDMEQAQVTAGGVDLDNVNPHTLESKITKGLYIVGELLDIDGICGGYNLTFAMLSGIKAGKSVYDKNQSN